MKDWKVGSPLQNLKNITIGSKKPKGVMNVPFHWFSSLMWILLNPHLMSNLVKNVEFFMSSINSGMRDRGCAVKQQTLLGE